MKKEQKIILIINWACVAALVPLFIISTVGVISFRNGMIGMAYGAIVGLFNSIWFTLRHKKYAFGIPSLVFSCIELAFVLSGVALSVAEIVHGGQVAVLVGVILLFLISGALVFKLTNEIKLLKAYRSGELKPLIAHKKKEIKIVPFREWFYVTHPKALFFPAAGFISMMSIFGMFGAVAKESLLGSTSPYNMFDVAFGLNKDGIQLSVSAGIIVLFGMLALLMILSIIDFFRNKKFGKGFAAYNIIRMILTLTTLILAFCSIKFVKELAGGEGLIKLGPGPLSIAILNIIAFVSYAVGFILQLIDVAKSNPATIHAKPTKTFKKTDTVSKTNEEANIDLLVKYKKLLDDGVITKKEYDEKKKNLLK